MPTRPTPTVLRLLRGNPGKRRINRDEPTPRALDLAVPDEVADDPIAVAEWNRVIVPAIEVGLITATDRALAVGYVTLVSQLRAERAAAAAAPPVILLGRNGYPAPHPLRTMANRTSQLLLRTAAELGFTPSSRSRVTADPHARRRTSAVETFMAQKTKTKRSSHALPD